MKNKDITAIASLLAAVLILEIAIRLSSIPNFILPLPSEVLVYIFRNFDFLSKHIFITLSEVLIGFGISILVAVMLAVVMIYSKVLERIFLPIIVISQTFPVIAIAPIIILWFGFGLLPKILIIIFISFFPLFMNLMKGFNITEKNTADLMISLNANRNDLLVKIRIPQSLPYFFSGLKSAAILAIIGAVVGEFVSAKYGLGYLVLIGKAQIDSNLIFSSLVFLGVLGYSLYSLINLAEVSLLRRFRMKPID